MAFQTIKPVLDKLARLWQVEPLKSALQFCQPETRLSAFHPHSADVQIRAIDMKSRT
jgi:hypothetical protein